MHRPLTTVGLSSAEVAARRRRDGPNVLPSRPGTPAWRQLLTQLTGFFALMLWCAAGLAVLAGMPPLAAAIAVVVLVNAVFAFVQEHRADRSAERLHDLLPRRTSVVRDGDRLEIDAVDLVVDDVVVLGIGDRITADLEALRTHSLSVDTSTLTGETVPVPVEVGAALYAGTFVTEGEGFATVTATGARTRLAGLAQLSRTTARPVSPLARQLHRVVRTISVTAVSVGVTFFVLMLAVGTPPAEGFLFAVGVTVALVPEGLLPTVTLSLAVAAQRMAGRNALVRHLEAVETLGSTTFICTDKTGTLTRNEMTVVEVWTPRGSVRVTGEGYDPTGRIVADDGAVATSVRQLAGAAARCSTGRVVDAGGRWVPQGDPMEAALDVLARRAGAASVGDDDGVPTTARYPFDPRRRRMSVVVDDWLLVKGAPDAVLDRVADAEGAERALAELARRGLRVLAVAWRALPPGTSESDPDVLEVDLTLAGLVGIEDPPREHVAAALSACRDAGLRVAMITGDHPATAAAVAAEVGLSLPDSPAYTGWELPEDEEVLGALLDRDGVVLSRVTPEDKVRIARAIRRRGHVVAMTGDGVNDGPALHTADIGIAMGATGTDVARDASDLVLLDDDFATIVAAIELGRATFANMRRFLTYHLTNNVAEVTPFLLWAASGGRFPLALGVLQILALDIGTDTFSAVALGAERPASGRQLGPPSRGRLLDGAVARRAFGVLGPTEATVTIAAFLAGCVAAGWRPGEAFPTGAPLAAASGAAFVAVVAGQTANAFACRSVSRPFVVGWRTNRFLLVAVSVELLISAAFLLIPAAADLLGHAVPPPLAWLVALAAAPAVLAVDTLHKHLRGDRRDLP
jgi:magnesium-transporting ATPase (P-type)